MLQCWQTQEEALLLVDSRAEIARLLAHNCRCLLPAYHTRSHSSYCNSSFSFFTPPTPPQGLLVAAIILMFSMLSLNMEMTTLAPQYSNWGSQGISFPCFAIFCEISFLVFSNFELFQCFFFLFCDLLSFFVFFYSRGFIAVHSVAQWHFWRSSKVQLERSSRQVHNDSNW